MPIFVALYFVVHFFCSIFRTLISLANNGFTF
uniref:Uncharacterized protein n=1 Tax=Rhizophora mucronata TaxID=61149 RepID=A0A2P2PYQ4_RHIMU